MRATWSWGRFEDIVSLPGKETRSERLLTPSALCSRMASTGQVTRQSAAGHRRESVFRGRLALGKRGEELAARRLAADGYRILERNYRCAAGEVDVVAIDGDCLVFVEVRTRRDDAWGSPEESVTVAKQARLATVAAHYLCENALEGSDWRIDVVAVEMAASGFVRRLEIIKDAVRL